MTKATFAQYLAPLVSGKYFTNNFNNIPTSAFVPAIIKHNLGEDNAADATNVAEKAYWQVVGLVNLPNIALLGLDLLRRLTFKAIDKVADRLSQDDAEYNKEIRQNVSHTGAKIVKGILTGLMVPALVLPLEIALVAASKVVSSVAFAIIHPVRAIKTLAYNIAHPVDYMKFLWHSVLAAMGKNTSAHFVQERKVKSSAFIMGKMTDNKPKEKTGLLSKLFKSRKEIELVEAKSLLAKRSATSSKTNSSQNYGAMESQNVEVSLSDKELIEKAKKEYLDNLNVKMPTDEELLAKAKMPAEVKTKVKTSRSAPAA